MQLATDAVAQPVEFRVGLTEYGALTTRLGMSRAALDRLALNDAAFPPRIRLGRKLYVSETELVRWFRMRTTSRSVDLA